MNALDPHFFRHEWARLVAVLVRVFGGGNLALAEDVAQDALFRAMQAWQIDGPPASPSAWLTAVAKRRAIDELRKARTEKLAAPELARMLDSEWTRAATVDELFAPKPLRDDELRMMFWLAQPRLPKASQVALVLQLCSGFGESEIAAAFLTTPVAIGKRLQRAKSVVTKSRAPSELVEADLAARLDVVHRAIYLLFNEGYHGACPEAAVRADLCREALRLVGLLVEHPATRTGATLALAAVLHLHAARLPSRLDEAVSSCRSSSSGAIYGIAISSRAGSRSSTTRRAAMARHRSTSKPRSPRVTRQRARSKRLRGITSSGSTTRSPRSRRHPSLG